MNIRVDGLPERRRDASGRSAVNKETEDALCRCRSRIVALPDGRPEIKIDRESIDRVYASNGRVAASQGFCYPAVVRSVMIFRTTTLTQSNIVTVSEVGGLRVGDAYNY